VFNLAQRCYQFPNKDFSYKAPNSIIQGGCADIARTAMIDLHKYLLDKQTKMILQVHDSILFEVHKSELDIVPVLSEKMVQAYVPKLLPMGVDIKFSKQNWGRLEPWVM
jgi:DNA polymerase-1